MGTVEPNSSSLQIPVDLPKTVNDGDNGDKGVKGRLRSRSEPGPQEIEAAVQKAFNGENALISDRSGEFSEQPRNRSLSDSNVKPLLSKDVPTVHNATSEVLGTPTLADPEDSQVLDGGLQQGAVNEGAKTLAFKVESGKTARLLGVSGEENPNIRPKEFLLPDQYDELSKSILNKKSFFNTGDYATVKEKFIAYDANKTKENARTFIIAAKNYQLAALEKHLTKGNRSEKNQKFDSDLELIIQHVEKRHDLGQENTPINTQMVFFSGIISSRQTIEKWKKEKGAAADMPIQDYVTLIKNLSTYEKMTGENIKKEKSGYINEMKKIKQTSPEKLINAIYKSFGHSLIEKSFEFEVNNDKYEVIRNEIHKFMLSEYSPENSMFLQAVNAYKNEPNQTKLETIITNHIKRGSDGEINISNIIRDGILNTNNFNGNELDDAQKEIKALIFRDTFPRFIKTPAALGKDAALGQEAAAKEKIFVDKLFQILEE